MKTEQELLKMIAQIEHVLERLRVFIDLRRRDISADQALTVVQMAQMLNCYLPALCWMADQYEGMSLEDYAEKHEGKNLCTLDELVNESEAFVTSLYGGNRVIRSKTR